MKGRGAEMDKSDHQNLNTELNVVYGYLRKLNISHEDAQDVVQETAYKFLLYYDSIKTPKIRSWLIRVALNYHHDQYRKNKRIKLDLKDEQIDQLSKDLPESILLQNEYSSDIKKVLSKVKPAYRELLLLKYIWELQYDEIADILNMKVGTIKTNLFRARKQFVKLWEEKL